LKANTLKLFIIGGVEGFNGSKKQAKREVFEVMKPPFYLTLLKNQIKSNEN